MSEEDMYVIEERSWVIGHGSQVMKRWHVGFDPRCEKLDKRHLWVLLPSFPVHCWNIKGFMGIINSIGNFILMEEDQLMGLSRRTIRVLLEVEVCDGPLEDIVVQWQGGTFIQWLDY